MAVSFELNAEPRQDQGKGASRRLRRAGRVPGIIYGSGKEAQAVSFDHNELLRNLAHESFYSHLLNVKMGDDVQQAILKDVQRHAYKPAIVHIDLLRVDADHEIRVHVPLHFLGEKECPGVKLQGGVVSHNLIDVEITCLPRHLPEYIEVDISQLNLGDAVHLTDLKLPEGVRIVALLHGEDHDLPVVAIHHARVTQETEPTEETPAAGEVPTTTEVKPEEEEK